MIVLWTNKIRLHLVVAVSFQLDHKYTNILGNTERAAVAADEVAHGNPSVDNVGNWSIIWPMWDGNTC